MPVEQIHSECCFVEGMKCEATSQTNVYCIQCLAEKLKPSGHWTKEPPKGAGWYPVIMIEAYPIRESDIDVILKTDQGACHEIGNYSDFDEKCVWLWYSEPITFPPLPEETPQKGQPTTQNTTSTKK